MSWLYLPGQVADYSPANCLVGEQFAMSNGIPMQSKSSRPECEMDTLTMLQSGTIVLVSTGLPGLDWWMSSLRVSHASRSAAPEKDWPKAIPVTDGLPSNASLAKYDLALRFWRTFRGLFPSLISDEYLGTWPRSGTMQNGVLYRRPPLGRIINGNGSGLLPTMIVARGTYQISPGSSIKRYSLYGMARHSLWPTPIKLDAKGSLGNICGDGRKKTNLAKEVKKFPTPNASAWKNREKRNRDYELSKVIGGQLNPAWVEWLMGWPIGWTDLKPLAMGRFRKWLEQH